jgi:hypothetical protein
VVAVRVSEISNSCQAVGYSRKGASSVVEMVACVQSSGELHIMANRLASKLEHVPYMVLHCLLPDGTFLRIGCWVRDVQQLDLRSMHTYSSHS